MNAGAVIVHQQRKAVRAFEERGCTSPEKARPLEELAVRRGLAIRALIRHGVLREVEHERFWLDVSAWEAFEARRRKIILFMLVIAAVVVSLALLLSAGAVAAP